MEFTSELVRRFFVDKKQWMIPMALILFILGALIVASDAPPAFAPFVYASGSM